VPAEQGEHSLVRLCLGQAAVVDPAAPHPPAALNRSRSPVSVTDRDSFARRWNLSVRCSSTGRSREGRAGTGQPMSDFKMAASCPRRMIASFW
jgi:hypothetical protein